jgi:modification target Cys-rich repeat protein
MRTKNVAGLVVASLAFAGCLQGGKFGALGAACPGLTGNADPMSLRFSANARADVKVRAFVASARDLVEVSSQVEAEAAEACRRIGQDLGMAPAELASQKDEPGESARVACNAVGARIDAMLRMGAIVRVSVQPPQCNANLDVQARCSGTCQVEVDPGEIVARCEPARLSGYCSGRCTGGCEGTCRGQCDGQCSARDASGQCVGRCSGTCSGACDATCHAHCEGQWQAPRCEGYVQGPSVDAECQASCNARAEFRGSCTPPQVAVQGGQNVADVMRLAATLQQNLPLLLHAEFALGKRLLASAETVVRVGAALPNVLGDAGAEALACTAAAADASVVASARIRVSVEASASVTGRVGAGT